MTLHEKLCRTEGMATVIVYDDFQNAERIKTILQAYLDNEYLQYSPRSANDWQPCMDLPWNFSEYRYRVLEGA